MMCVQLMKGQPKLISRGDKIIFENEIEVRHLKAGGCCADADVGQNCIPPRIFYRISKGASAGRAQIPLIEAMDTILSSPMPEIEMAVAVLVHMT